MDKTKFNKCLAYKAKLACSNEESLLCSKNIILTLHSYELENKISPLKRESVHAAYDFLIDFQRKHGPNMLLDLVKSSRQMVLMYLSGEKPVQTSKMWMKTDSKGLPTGLGDLKNIKVLTDPRLLRFTMTVLYTTRHLEFSGSYDFSTLRLTDGIEIDPIWISFLNSRNNSLNWLPKVFKFVETKYHVSTKAGPNGPALVSSMLDLGGMPEHYRLKLIEFCSFYPGYNMVQETLKLNKVQEVIKPQLEGKRYLLRKLEIIPDKEGKKRAIAISDYGTQVLMKSLHTSLNDVLRAIKEDCTFNQDNYRQILNRDNTTYYSIDLRLATELMPANWQAEVLKGVSGSNRFGELGLDIMVSEPFYHKDGDVLFRRGQPMGIYSSGPVMAITHHMLVRWAAERAGVDLKGQQLYALLGDDLLIADDRLYTSYKEVIDLCKMQLNLTKTFKSKDLVEFAKRFHYKGHEITPFPVGSILASRGQLPNVAMAIDTAINRSGLSNSFKKSASFDNFLSSIIKVVEPSFPRRLTKELKLMMGATEIGRGVMRKEALSAPGLTGLHFMTFPCNINRFDALRNKLLEHLAGILICETGEKIQGHQDNMNMLLSALETSIMVTSIELVNYHPIYTLSTEFDKKLQQWIGELVERAQSDVGEKELNFDQLMLDLVDPLPSLEVMYRQEKRSIRKITQIGRIASVGKGAIEVKPGAANFIEGFIAEE